MGMDWYWVNECTNRKPLRYSDFNIGDELRTDEPALREQRDWIGTTKEKLNKFIAVDCDQIIAGLYENYVCYEPYFKEKTHFIPLPIKMPESDILHPLELRSLATEGTQEPSSISPQPSTLSHHPSSIFIGISKGRSAYKGTDIMLRAAEDVLRAHPDKMKLIKAEGIPFNEYQKLMDGSDAILDQLYSYTPSMNPLLAMSKGIICIGGGEPENYEILGENELRPIINVQPTYESVRDELEQFVLHPERIPELKRQSIEYVRRHHDYIKVARQYERIYSE
jgi:glycosyltransferase involved in cell wall biosynthesis